MAKPHQSNSHYVIPFKALLKQVGIDEQQIRSNRITLTSEQLYSLIGALLSHVSVDEEWYKKMYPDVGQALTTGVIESARGHFITAGYFEGRIPGKVIVDEEFYKTKYEDVAEGIEVGDIDSAQEHFDLYGFMEGRKPYEA